MPNAEDMPGYIRLSEWDKDLARARDYDERFRGTELPELVGVPTAPSPIAPEFCDPAMQQLLSDKDMPDDCKAYLSQEQRDTFSTGYQRDSSSDKPAYEMMPPEALEELALLYTEGAKKYGAENYRKGAPIKRTCASMLRHAHKALAKVEDEGSTARARRVRHFIATAWNALAAAQHLIDIDAGKLPSELDDR